VIAQFPVLYSNAALESKLPRDIDSLWPSAANKGCESWKTNAQHMHWPAVTVPAN